MTGTISYTFGGKTVDVTPREDAATCATLDNVYRDASAVADLSDSRSYQDGFQASWAEEQAAYAFGFTDALYGPRITGDAYSAWVSQAPSKKSTRSMRRKRAVAFLTSWDRQQKAWADLLLTGAAVGMSAWGRAMLGLDMLDMAPPVQEDAVDGSQVNPTDQASGETQEHAQQRDQDKQDVSSTSPNEIIDGLAGEFLAVLESVLADGTTDRDALRVTVANVRHGLDRVDAVLNLSTPAEPVQEDNREDSTHGLPDVPASEDVTPISNHPETPDQAFKSYKDAGGTLNRKNWNRQQAQRNAA